MKKLYTTLFIAITFSTLAQVNWKVDAGHGYCGFSLKYMLIGDYKGQFKNFEGKVVTKTETDFTDAVFNIVIDINSVSAEEEGHEEMLTGSEFFDAAKHPLAFFRSSSVKAGKTNGTYILEGDLTIRGITKKVSFIGIAAAKPVTNPYFNTTNYGLAINGTLKRSDFGIGFYHLMNDGEMVLSDDVNFNCTLILVRSANAFVSMTSKIKVDEKILSAYVGQYDTGKWGIFSVSAEQGKLFTKIGEQPKKEIIPMGENKFFYEFRDATLEFFKDDNGKVNKLIQYNGANKTEAPKINDTPEEQKLPVAMDATVEPNYNAEAWEALLAGNYTLTIEYCTKGISKGPNRNLSTRLAHAYLFSGNHTKAIELYKEGITNEKTKGAYAKKLQEDFTFLRSRQFSAEVINKAFTALAIEPNAAYKGMK